MNDPIKFDVIGVPMPQGSAKAFVANGKARMAPSGGTGFAAWRNAVAEAARANAPDTPLDCPVRLIVTFWFPMPTSRPKKTRALGQVPKTTAPDIDKLVRCISDALVAGAVIVDDARIVSLHADKFETADGWTGAEIRVRELR